MCLTRSVRAQRDRAAPDPRLRLPLGLASNGEAQRFLLLSPAMATPPSSLSAASAGTVWPLTDEDPWKSETAQIKPSTRGRGHESRACAASNGTQGFAHAAQSRRGLDPRRPSLWGRSAAVSNKDLKARAERLAIFVGLGHRPSSCWKRCCRTLRQHRRIRFRRLVAERPRGRPRRP